VENEAAQLSEIISLGAERLSSQCLRSFAG
jgi:hypothetical protein